METEPGAAIQLQPAKVDDRESRNITINISQKNQRRGVKVYEGSRWKGVIRAVDSVQRLQSQAVE